MVVTLGQQYHVGEKPTVILYTYINHRAGTPDKTKRKDTMSLDYNLLNCVYYMNRIGWVSMKEIYCSMYLPYLATSIGIGIIYYLLSVFSQGNPVSNKHQIDD